MGKTEEEKLDESSLDKNDSSSWPLNNASGGGRLYEHTESQHSNDTNPQQYEYSQDTSTIIQSSNYISAANLSALSNLNINAERAKREALENKNAQHNIQNEVGFLDQEWKDRSTGSKVGYVLANIFTFGGITWGRKMISSCERCLDNINQESEIIFGDK